jgi:hypothetical protein
MSVSVRSNVPGYEKAECFISDGSGQELIKRFVDYLWITLIQQKSLSLLEKEYEDIFRLLDLQSKKEEELEEGFEKFDFSNFRAYKAQKCEWLVTRFAKFLACIPVIGFNSGSYDLNVMKGPLLHYLSKDTDINFAIKRGSRLQCVQVSVFGHDELPNSRNFVRQISPNFRSLISKRIFPL